MKRRKKKAGSLRSGCPTKDQDKPSLLMEMLLISIANHHPEPGAGEAPCAGTRFANEGKFPQDHFHHFWVFFSGHTAATAHEAGIYVVFLNVPKG